MYLFGRLTLVINCLLLYCLREVVPCLLTSQRNAHACTDDEFRCANGDCIGQQLVCDQENDCDDDSDELDCTDNTAVCSVDQFTCSPGECIPATWLCDGDTDCVDESDERGCPCSHDEFECFNGECILSTWLCDGDTDCADGSDELGCSTSCPPHMFQCLDWLSCIPLDWRCDTEHDCSDSSDEFNCDVPTPDPGFTCFNGTWIPGNLRCDSIPHCQVAEDEQACNECAKNGFHCSDRRCIPSSQYCDGVDNCGNWSDEPLDCEPSCMKDNGRCEQICSEQDGVVTCACHEGYEVFNSTHCQDYNECSAESSPCPGQPMLCSNTPGSYRCMCPPEFVYDAAKQTCYSNESFSPTVIFASRRKVMYLAQANFNVTEPFTGNKLNNIVAMDFSSQEGYIFLSANQNIIKLLMPSPVEVSVVADVGVGAVDGLAFDWVYENLYFTEKLNQRIEVINVNTLMRRILFDTELEEPRAIAVDPERGFVYFSDCSPVNPKIEKAGMDGTYREIIISENLQWPNGLCIEYTLQRLFWVNAFVDPEHSYIASSNLDGENIKILVEESHLVKQPFAITVLQDKLYWTDWRVRGVVTANSFTGADGAVVLNTVYSPRGIRVFNRRVQYGNGELKKCPTDKFACSHMCLASPNQRHYSCSCPGTTFVGDDGRTCYCNDTVLLGKDGISCGIIDSTSSTEEPKSVDPHPGNPIELPTHRPTAASLRLKLPMNCLFEDRVLWCESKVTNALPSDAPHSIGCRFFTNNGTLVCTY